VKSGGIYPTSLTVSGNVVYALNAAGNGTVAGFRLSRNGQLQPIPGSVRSLNLATPNMSQQPNLLFSPADIGFSPDGDWLVVTDKNFGGIGKILTFKVDDDGLLSKTPVTTASPDAVPFGFTFDRRGHLLVTETAVGAMTSYNINDNGTLQPISLSVSNGNRALLATQPCWVDTTRNFAFVVNTLSQDITSYRLNRRGELSLLSATRRGRSDRYQHLRRQSLRERRDWRYRYRSVFPHQSHYRCLDPYRHAQGVRGQQRHGGNCGRIIRIDWGPRMAPSGR
jgi:hypothetical protein